MIQTTTTVLNICFLRVLIRPRPALRRPFGRKRLLKLTSQFQVYAREWKSQQFFKKVKKNKQMRVEKYT